MIQQPPRYTFFPYTTLFRSDNAIFEYINGKLIINHDPSYTVMTNDPIFSEQLAINEYWKGIPGNIFSPGTNRAAEDRKSTRLNSSHVAISYAVFCLKKKKL